MTEPLLPPVMTEPVAYEGSLDADDLDDSTGWSPWQMVVFGGAKVNTPAAGQLIALARGIAIGAHAGQVDKAGEPYIGHVGRVAGRLTDPVDQAVAWLHDVLEDTPVTAAHLIAAGLPGEVVAAVVVLTHLTGEPRVDYYARVRGSRRARRVKLADIADNSDPERLAQLDAAARGRLTAKYAKAREALGG